MTSDQELHSTLSELLLLTFEGAVDKEQFEQLDRLMIDCPSARQYYFDFLTVYVALTQFDSVIDIIRPNSSEIPTSEELLLEVIEQDENHRARRAAEKARLEAETKRAKVKQAAEKAFETFKEDERRRQEKLAYKRYRTRQRRLVLSVGALAACLLLTFGLWIHDKLTTPSPAVSESPSPPVVAKIIQSWEAQWENPHLKVEPGTLLTASAMKLNHGLVKIAFHDGAEIVLQSPCILTLEDTNQMYIESGNLSAEVPEQAIGFTVRTPGATIVDYGTEFGVTAHANGETEAHVFKGEVDLRSGSNARVFRQSHKLKSGEANRVDRAGHISRENFKAHPSRFLRQLPQKKTFGKVGERLDLADVVAGGNGFGTGSRTWSIDPLSGGIKTEFTAPNRGNLKHFNPIPEIPFLDGVFVPDGGAEPVTISSQGHKFFACPDTDGITAGNICNSLNTFWKIAPEKIRDHMNVEFILNNKRYDTPMNPAIFLHANAGITFDLAAIRSAIPGIRIVKFKSLCGMCESILVNGENKTAKVDFWVLVDGRVQFSARGLSPQQGGSAIEVPLRSQDRFLTLVTTDAGDKGVFLNAITTDWGIFAEPMLELSLVTKEGNIQ